MEKEFCKIFIVNGQQVLILKEEDSDDDSSKLTQIADCNNMRFSMAIGFDEYSDREKAFDEYGQDNAEKFMEIVNKNFNWGANEEKDNS